MASASFIPIVVHDVMRFDFRHQAVYWLFIMYTDEATEHFHNLWRMQFFTDLLICHMHHNKQGKPWHPGFMWIQRTVFWPSYKSLPFGPVISHFQTRFCCNYSCIPKYSPCPPIHSLIFLCDISFVCNRTMDLKFKIGF